jgi:hypothetical protein
MTTARSRRTRIASSLQLALVLLALCLDFGHGILLGEHNIGFLAVYRLRQTVAVAISRMRMPPLHGYLAYQSVIDALDENGFAIFEADKGPHLDVNGWDALFKDSARLDSALQQANDIAIDGSLPPQIIQGNELAYADYAYFAFSLFGLHFSSFYYFYFVLLVISCVLFIAEFRSSSFLMFLLTSYLAALMFLENYAQSQGSQLATLTNSRLFEALSLLPAMHVVLAIWRRLPPRLPTIATVSGQSLLLVFLVDCRTTAMWQIALIVTAGVGAVLARALARYGIRAARSRPDSGGVWPSIIVIGFLALHVAMINFAADTKYATEPKYHVVWHEILRGILGASPELQREYVGRDEGTGSGTDQIAYDAVMRDLNVRNDRTSSIAFVANGRIYISLERGWSEYERLARSLTLRIILAHPFVVIGGLSQKFSDQARLFTRQHAMALNNMAGALMLTALGGILWLAAGGAAAPVSEIRKGAALAVLVCSFAAVPLLIEPSALSVGSLLSFMIAGAMGIGALAVMAIQVAERCWLRKDAGFAEKRPADRVPN